MTDVELKNRGNKLFAARKYEEAITCYSDAIVSDAGDDLESCKIQMICEFSRMYSWCAVLYSGCIFMCLLHVLEFIDFGLVIRREVLVFIFVILICSP